MEYVYGRVWAGNYLSSMVSTSTVVASGWIEESVVFCVAGQRCYLIEGILTFVIVRYRRTLV